MNWRLLAIELRRNERLWLFPLVMAGYGLWVWEFFPDHSLLFWSQTSVQVRNAVALLGPVTGAVAAWAASREHRRGLDELVEITPRPALERQLTVLGGSLLLGVTAYLVVAVAVFVWTATRAAADGPYVKVQLPALAGIVAMAALGFAAGRIVPRRTTPIVVAAVCSALLSLPISFFNSWLQLLSPVDSLDASPWYGIRPDVGVAQTLFLLGFAGLGLAGIASASQARRLIMPALIGAAVLLALGGGTIHGSGNMVYRDEVLPYEPVCQGEPVVVCVHPAYAPALDTLATRVNELVAPLAGLPQVPMRFEQFAPLVGPAPDANDFYLDGGSVNHIDGTLNDIADELVWGSDASRDIGSPTWQARTVVQVWLLEAAGIEISCHDDFARHITDNIGFGMQGVPCDALAHFTALDPDVRSQWLRSHYAALLAGRITLKDLP